MNSIQNLLAVGRLPLAAIVASAPISERGGENPSPTGPEGERVGDKDGAKDAPPESNKQLEPIPGPGAPMIPDHPTIDSNPIDPRVF